VLLGVILAALSAGLLNILIPRVLKKPGLRYLVPASEELCKTATAVLLRAPVWQVHTGFGLVEAAYEVYLKPSSGVLAGSLAILLHTGLGFLTAAVMRRAGVPVAMLVASVVHTSWNLIAVRLAGGHARNR
jgi:hypothetical protein